MESIIVAVTRGNGVYVADMPWNDDDDSTCLAADRSFRGFHVWQMRSPEPGTKPIIRCPSAKVNSRIRITHILFFSKKYAHILTYSIFWYVNKNIIHRLKPKLSFAEEQLFHQFIEVGHSSFVCCAILTSGYSGRWRKPAEWRSLTMKHSSPAST